MISNEAVEAAMASLYSSGKGGVVTMEDMRAALEAAAPYIQAAVLREAAEHLEYGNPINQWLSDRADEIEAGYGA